MKELRLSVEEYIELRRSVGFDIRCQAGILRDFARFAEKQRATFVTIDLVLEWAKESRTCLPSTIARRVSVIRRFARWLSASDPRTQVPPEGLFPFRFQRKRPYIYSDRDLKRILRGFDRLRSVSGLRCLTCKTIIALVAVTGMRISEALALDRDDVDLEQGVVTIRRTKFAKSRLVPLHETTRRALAAYAEKRDGLARDADAQGFFIAENGRRLTPWSLQYCFARVCQLVGVRKRMDGYKHGRGPRIHDLRHRFAATTLLNWYRSDVDVERELPKLSTYLGHAQPSHTYWYLEALPELLQLATERLMRRSEEPAS